MVVSFSPGFFLRVSQIRKFGIIKFTRVAQANPEAVSAYIVQHAIDTRILWYAFRNLRSLFKR